MRDSHVKGQVIAAAIQLLMTLEVMDVELAIVDLILFFKQMPALYLLGGIFLLLAKAGSF